MPGFNAGMAQDFQSLLSRHPCTQGFDGKTFPYKSRGEYQSLVYSENSKLGLSVTVSS